VQGRQGFCLTFFYVSRLSYRNKLRGICSFNGYTVPLDIMEELGCFYANGKNRDTPIEAMNANTHPYVGSSFAEECFENLKEFHPRVKFEIDFQGKDEMLSSAAIYRLSHFLEPLTLEN